MENFSKWLWKKRNTTCLKSLHFVVSAHSWEPSRESFIAEKQCLHPGIPRKTWSQTVNLVAMTANTHSKIRWQVSNQHQNIPKRHAYVSVKTYSRVYGVTFKLTTFQAMQTLTGQFTCRQFRLSFKSSQDTNFVRAPLPQWNVHAKFLNKIESNDKPNPIAAIAHHKSRHIHQPAVPQPGQPRSCAVALQPRDHKRGTRKFVAQRLGAVEILVEIGGPLGQKQKWLNRCVLIKTLQRLPKGWILAVLRSTDFPVRCLTTSMPVPRASVPPLQP